LPEWANDPLHDARAIPILPGSEIQHAMKIRLAQLIAMLVHAVAFGADGYLFGTFKGEQTPMSEQV
jgi:hypothetical protein